jgi:hypothetical protein
MVLSAAQRRAKIEAAKALMQEVENDDVPATTSATTTKAAVQAAAQAAVATKAAPATPTATAPAGNVTPVAVNKPAAAPEPVTGDQVAAHADHNQPPLRETLMSVAQAMKAKSA